MSEDGQSKLSLHGASEAAGAWANDTVGKYDERAINFLQRSLALYRKMGLPESHPNVVKLWNALNVIVA
jgi:hypothetical protein